MINGLRLYHFPSKLITLPTMLGTVIIFIQVFIYIQIDNGVNIIGWLEVWWRQRAGCSGGVIRRWKASMEPNRFRHHYAWLLNFSSANNATNQPYGGLWRTALDPKMNLCSTINLIDILINFIQYYDIQLLKYMLSH